MITTKRKKSPLLLFFLMITCAVLLCSCKKEQSPVKEVEIYDYTGRALTEFLDGKKYSVALVNYWATYCSPCKKEIPELVKLYDAYKKEGLLVVGASIDQTENYNLVLKLARLLGINYPVVYGLSSFFKEVEVTALPTTFIIKEGRVVETITGKADYTVFEEAVKKHLASGSVDTNTLTAASGPSLSGPSGPGPNRKVYTLQAALVDKTEKSAGLLVSIKSEGDYKLSGEGYPPVKVTLKEKGGLTAAQKEFTIPGVDAASSATWKTGVTYPENSAPVSINFHVYLAACLEDTCIIVDEDVEVFVKNKID